MGRVLPIIFNGDMVRAILEGRKTVTRRKIDLDISNQFDTDNNGNTAIAYIDQATGDSYRPEDICRYQPGDILYVRETIWRQFGKTLDMMTGETCFYDMDHFAYCATDQAPMGDDYHSWRKIPSIHMPKQAARIWLKVTDVRTELLQAITEEQARREGAVGVRYDVNTGQEESAALEWFPIIWDSTIKKPDIARYGWDANPWVWVIEFERCGKPEP